MSLFLDSFATGIVYGVVHAAAGIECLWVLKAYPWMVLAGEGQQMSNLSQVGFYVLTLETIPSQDQEQELAGPQTNWPLS
ncbi:hypothetical protein GGU10DRAFT_381435 [Lentinula aff. detonsa]|uniref:Uncharacterized protein n=1 Tax=Lentinula aff. detonsa TaxID=2804958 RepID=A0AA38KT08_9AGAR|nr:hypothetical protein GGU10DRAFT_381435 [Lentinula aff. detonsa]